MHVFRPRTDLTRVLVAMAPLMGAAWIAISRVEDYRHDALDVACGSFLGMLTAYFSYHRYYPSLKSTRCDRPFSCRYESAARKEQNMPKDDEEEGLTLGTRTDTSDSLEVGETYPLNDVRDSP